MHKDAIPVSDACDCNIYCNYCVLFCNELIKGIHHMMQKITALESRVNHFGLSACKRSFSARSASDSSFRV